MNVIHEVNWKIGLQLCMAFRMGCGGRCEFVDGENALYGTDRDDIRFRKEETLGRSFVVADEGVATSLSETQRDMMFRVFPSSHTVGLESHPQVRVKRLPFCEQAIFWHPGSSWSFVQLVSALSRDPPRAAGLGVFTQAAEHAPFGAWTPTRQRVHRQAWPFGFWGCWAASAVVPCQSW